MEGNIKIKLIEFFKKERDFPGNKGICKECGIFQTHKLQRCKCGGEFEFIEKYTLYKQIYRNIHVYSNSPTRYSKGFWYELWKREISKKVGLGITEEEFWEVFESI